MFANFGNLTWQMVVMWVIGGLLIYLAIAKKMEPSLLLPMGFGAILVNLPLSGRGHAGDDGVTEPAHLSVLFDAGIANELFPLLLFIGIGAMIDFGPLLSNPKLMLFGAAAQFGIFFTLVLAALCGFDLPRRGVHRRHRRGGRPDGHLRGEHPGQQIPGRHHGGGVFSYMALVPIVQPPVIRLLHDQKRAADPDAVPAGQCQQDRPKFCSRLWSPCWPGLSRPPVVALVGFLMFGNLLRECGVLNALSETAQNVLANLITIAAGPDRGRSDDRRRIRPARHTADPGAGSGRVYL